MSVDALEGSDDRRPAAVSDASALRREDEVVRATVGGIRDLADVAARDEPTHVVADRRRRQARLGRERSGRDGLESRHPADEREELVGDVRLSRAPRPRAARRGARSSRAPAGGRRRASEYSGTARIIRWTSCEFVGKLVRIRRYLGGTDEARSAPRHRRQPASQCTTARPGSPSMATGRIPQAHAVRACARRGPYWPTMTLALQGRTAWVACKEQARSSGCVFPAAARRRRSASSGQVIAVAVGLRLGVGARHGLDALPHRSTRTARVTKRIQLGASAAYNIWIGAGAVWVADDQGAASLRVSPSTNKVVARIPVGDGPADMVFRGSQAWVVTHRDNTLFRIDTTTNAATRLGIVGGSNAAAERLALLGDGLWITGRGVSLVEMDPATGAVRRTVDVGGTGIDVVAAAGALWVPVRTAAVDRTGFPTMTALRRVDSRRAASRRSRRRGDASTSTASPPGSARSGSPTTRAACCIGSRRDRSLHVRWPYDAGRLCTLDGWKAAAASSPSGAAIPRISSARLREFAEQSGRDGAGDAARAVRDADVEHGRRADRGRARPDAGRRDRPTRRRSRSVTRCECSSPRRSRSSRPPVRASCASSGDSSSASSSRRR